MVEFEPCCSSYSAPQLRAVPGDEQDDSAEHTSFRTYSGFGIRRPSDSALPTFRCFSGILFPLFLIATLTLATDHSTAQNTGKCYSFSPGLTILGADYRRDFGLSRRQCADVCKSDLCCMAFEWRRLGGQCTLKSRSLNGTVTAAMPKSAQILDGEKESKAADANKGEDDVFFALCVDYGDSDRDRFWDHELGGPVVASASTVKREKCAQLCGEFSVGSGDARKRRGADGAEGEAGRREAARSGGRAKRRTTQPADSAVIYSWRTRDPADMESPLGDCQCISVLHHVRLSFGSFSGFLI